MTRSVLLKILVWVVRIASTDHTSLPTCPLYIRINTVLVFYVDNINHVGDVVMTRSLLLRFLISKRYYLTNKKNSIEQKTLLTLLHTNFLVEKIKTMLLNCSLYSLSYLLAIDSHHHRLHCSITTYH